MRKTIIAGAFVAALGCGAANAGDAKANCEEFSANNGIDPGPCACIADSVEGDADLMAELEALETMADYENASAALHNAMDHCIE